VTVVLTRPAVYCPIWESLLAERRWRLNAAQLAVVEAQAQTAAALGGAP
jgi:hypothetical protein